MINPFLIIPWSLKITFYLSIELKLYFPGNKVIKQDSKNPPISSWVLREEPYNLRYYNVILFQYSLAVAVCP